MNKQNYIIGVLILTLTLTGVLYIALQDNGVRMRFDKEETTFYIKEINEEGEFYGRWLISGIEQNRLFNGTKLVRRSLQNTKLNYYCQECINTMHLNSNGSYVELEDCDWIKVEDFNNVSITSKYFKVERITPYNSGTIITDTYLFRTELSNVELFPISHDINIINGTNLFYRYTVDRLTDAGNKTKLINETKLFFGKRMSLELEENYRWAWIGYPYGSDSVSAQYDINTNNETFNIRLYDPLTPPTGGRTYYDLSYLNDLWGDNDATNYGSTSETIYPTFNINGDSSPNSSAFDNSYIDTGIRLGTQNSFSVSLWLKVNDYSTNTDNNPGFFGHAKSGGGELIYMYYNTLAHATVDIRGKIGFAFRPNGGDSSGGIESENAYIQDGNWHHIVGTYNVITGRTELYIDGNFEGNNTYDTTLFSGAYNEWIGLINNGGSKGSDTDSNIDEVKIYDYALSSTEITNLYEHNTNSYINSEWVEIYSDDFNDGSINTTFWTATTQDAGTSISESGGKLLISSSSGYAHTGGTLMSKIDIDTLMNNSDNKLKIEAYVMVTNWYNTAYGEKIGFSDITTIDTGYYAIPLKRSEGGFYYNSGTPYYQTISFSDGTSGYNNNTNYLGDYRNKWYVQELIYDKTTNTITQSFNSTSNQTARSSLIRTPNYLYITQGQYNTNVNYYIDYIKVYELQEIPITDTCTCAGLNTNWEIDMSDTCVLITSCELGSGNISFIGSGNFTVNSTLNITNLGDPKENGTIFINNNSIINIG